jgi:RHS repeat-associated protein
MEMPGRKYELGTRYRYSFNGKENDNEVKGEGNQLDYGMRIYDPRLGKFLSVDPFSKNYPMLTPYQFAGNSPIAFVDLDGREPEWYLVEQAEKIIFGTNHIQKIHQGFNERAVQTAKSIMKPKEPPKDWYKQFLFQPNQTVIDPTGGTNPEAIFIATKQFEQALKGAANDFKDLFNRVLRGDDKAIGALGFEAVLIFMPGGDEIEGLKAETKMLASTNESIKVYSTIVKNSADELVVRKFVTNETDLLKVAEDAAGGSLDNFKEFKPNWYEGEINGKKYRIEWQPGGEPHMGEGPHVKILEWDPTKGKKGKWITTEKYYQLDHSTLSKIKKASNK